MNRRNNPQRSVRFADVAPEPRPDHNGPQGGRPHCQYCDQLQFSLAQAHRQIADWNQWNESVQPILSSANVEKASFNRKVLYLKSEISKRDTALETKEKEFAVLLKRRNDTICERGLEISHLQKCLERKSTEPKRWKEECMTVKASWEAEKETVSKLKQEKMEIEEEWQKKVKMLEDQLSHKDAELVTLREEKEEIWNTNMKRVEDLSEKLKETSNLLSSKDTELLQTKAMNRRNNPQRSVRFADVAPEPRPDHNGPQGGRPHCQYCDQLQFSLAQAHRQIADWNQWNESVQPILSSANVEKASFNRKVLYLKSEISKRDTALETKEKEFAVLLKRRNDTICERGLEISHLQKCLERKSTEPKRWKEECMTVKASWEAEKETVSKLKQEKMEIEEEWQKKVKMLEDQLSHKDAELVTLREEKEEIWNTNMKRVEDLSEKLKETSNLLSSKDTELLQTKCDLETLKEKLTDQEEIWEASKKQMNEEKKDLQDLHLKEKEDLCEKLKETSSVLSSKDTELLQTKAMNRRNNPQRSVRFADVAPEPRPDHNGPQGGRPHCQYCDQLQFSLAQAHRQIADWNQWNESVQPILSSANVEKASFNRKVLYLKSEISKRDTALETKEKEFAVLLKRRNDTICERGLEISHLQKCLERKSTEPKRWKEECMTVKASWEAEKETVSKLKQEKMEIEEEWQKKVKMLEDQLSHKDAELITLREEKEEIWNTNMKKVEDLSEKLKETSNLLSSKDTELLQTKAMNRRNNPQRSVRFADVAPEPRPDHNGPQGGRPHCQYCDQLQFSLAQAHRQIADWNQWNESVQPILSSANVEKASFNRKVLYLKSEISKRDTALETKEKEFAVLLKRRNDTICERGLEISHLQKCLERKSTEPKRWKEECMTVKASWEAEKETVSKLKQEKMEIKEEWQKKVKMLEDQLSHKDAELVTLREEKEEIWNTNMKKVEDLSEKLKETSNLLSSKDTELLQTKDQLHQGSTQSSSLDYNLKPLCQLSTSPHLSEQTQRRQIEVSRRSQRRDDMLEEESVG
ncbi:hypothetical protein PAMA_020080 [Pampus argenteus]